MSQKPNKDNPRIRRIAADEGDSDRQWPKKKHLASEHPELMPKPGEKNKIHSILTALPVLMLMIGLYVYFKAEREQNAGLPLVSELVSIQGEYGGVSTASSGGNGQHFLWLLQGDDRSGLRVTADQLALLKQLKKGVALTVEAAPTVAGSKVLWAYSVKNKDALVIEPRVKD